MNENGEETKIKVEDKRHWARDDRDEEAEGSGETDVSTVPTVVEEYRQRAEEAERRLHEYIDAFKQARDEQEQFRSRLRRDVDRRVELQFGEVVGELLDAIDDLDLALGHVRDVAEAQPLAEGVALARDRFLGTLEKRGVTRVEPTGETFDPNVAEALRVDPVEDAARDGQVTETMRPGYRIGDHVIRPARVAVGKHSG